MRRPVPVVALAATLFLSACAALGSAWKYIITERPPYPLRSIELASDARVDTSGVIVGTLVGSGTDDAVTLVSSDTGFIAELARTYLPADRYGDRDLWSVLARAGEIPLPLGRRRPSSHMVDVADARVASPNGHSDVALRSVVLVGSSCGWRGARAEITLSGPLRGSRAPSLRGPVLGSFRPGAASDDRAWRDAPPWPAPAVIDDLVDRTTRDMDSILSRRVPRTALPLAAPTGQHLILDPLEDVDAAEVMPLWSGNGRVRYAVAVRATRVTARGDQFLASTVMIWDEAGTWRQSVLAPGAVALRRNRFTPLDAEVGGSMLPLYWRRLDAVSGFGLDRDYLVLEQVDVEDGSVYWGAIEARSNEVAAAAEMGGACVDDDRDPGRGQDRGR